VYTLQKELSDLVDYLLILSNAAIDENDIKYCTKSIKNFLDILDRYTFKEFSFIEIAIKEFEELSREIIEEIKIKSRNFIEISNLQYIWRLIKRLYLVFENNVFIANEVFYIRSEIAGKKTCLPDVLKDYLKIGEALKDEDSVKNLKNDLARLRTSGNDSCAYYAAIIGPSFLGKTQTAFTLSHVMNVIYVNLLAADIAVQGSDGSLSQPIYNHFEDFSNLFYQTIDQDLKETENNAPGYISCKNSGYQTLGLL